MSEQKQAVVRSLRWDAINEGKTVTMDMTGDDDQMHLTFVVYNRGIGVFGDGDLITVHREGVNAIFIAAPGLGDPEREASEFFANLDTVHYPGLPDQTETIEAIVTGMGGIGKDDEG